MTRGELNLFRGQNSYHKQYGIENREDIMSCFKLLLVGLFLSVGFFGNASADDKGITPLPLAQKVIEYVMKNPDRKDNNVGANGVFRVDYWKKYIIDDKAFYVIIKDGYSYGEEGCTKKYNGKFDSGDMLTIEVKSGMNTEKRFDDINGDGYKYNPDKVTSDWAEISGMERKISCDMTKEEISAVQKEENKTLELIIAEIEK